MATVEFAAQVQEQPRISPSSAKGVGQGPALERPIKAKLANQMLFLPLYLPMSAQESNTGKPLRTPEGAVRPVRT